jgi:hypothetical protein
MKELSDKEIERILERMKKGEFQWLSTEWWLKNKPMTIKEAREFIDNQTSN